MTTAPHLAFPFRVRPLVPGVIPADDLPPDEDLAPADNTGKVGVATVAQGSREEIAQRVYAIVGTRLGERSENVEMGVPSYLFRQGGVDEAELRRLVEEQEPRVTLLTESEWAEMAETVRVVIQ